MLLRMRRRPPERQCIFIARLRFADHGADRLDDVLVAGAAAQIARQAFADLVVGRERIFLDQIGRGHQHARRAEAALQGVMLVERLLQRVQLPMRAEALDRLDAAAVGLHREHQAGAHAVAVDQHRAGAAHAVLAADMGAGQPERVAQEIGEQQARLDRASAGGAVHGDCDVARRSCGAPCARRQAASSARPVSTPTRWRR